MSKTEQYFFHQTPRELASILVKTLPLTDGDILYEPFRGEGAFYDAFPEHCTHVWAEIQDGIDYRERREPVDWVITNPPYVVDGKNALCEMLAYSFNIARTGVAILINAQCFNSLTPRRREQWATNYGFHLSSVLTCNVKKWANRYYFAVFTKNQPDNLGYIVNSF